MAITFKYDAQSHVLVASVTGSPSMEEMESSARELVTSSDYPAKTNTLWDLSAMEFHSIDYKFAKKLVEMREGIRNERAGIKIALLSDYDLGKPLLELYCILSAKLPQQMRIFCSREKAMAWLSA